MVPPSLDASSSFDVWSPQSDLSPTGYAATVGSSKRVKRRKVLFKSVEVREMFIQIGESSVPGDGGPPLGLSPRLKRTLTHDLDNFELERETGRRLKSSVGSPMPQRIGKERFAREGRVPPHVRRLMLEQVCTSEDRQLIDQAENDARKILQNRMDSNKSIVLALQSMSEAISLAEEDRELEEEQESGQDAKEIEKEDGDQEKEKWIQELDEISSGIGDMNRFYGAAELFF